MAVTDGKHLERIKRVCGKWIMVEYDEEASIRWIGLPVTSRRNDHEKTPAGKIIVPEGAIEKGADTRMWERVYKIIGVGPDAWVDEPNKEPLCEVGDFVIAKGNVPTQVAVDPVCYPIQAVNIVAVLDIDMSDFPLTNSLIEKK